MTTSKGTKLGKGGGGVPFGGNTDKSNAADMNDHNLLKCVTTIIANRFETNSLVMMCIHYKNTVQTTHTHYWHRIDMLKSAGWGCALNRKQSYPMEA